MPDRKIAEASQDAREARWADLMHAAQGGDAEAFELLLRDILPSVRGLVAARLREASEMEDVVQTVLIALFRARHTFENGRPFGPWLRAIARNAVIDAQRRSSVRRRREVPLVDVAEPASAEATPERESPLAPELVRALESLPPSQREAVELIHLEQLSVAEAPERAGTPPGALKVRAHRGYRALRAWLEGSRK